MYRIISGRGTGKTSRLMLLAKENDAVIVCRHPEHMREKAHAYGITGLKFMSYYDFLVAKANEETVGSYLIDEMEDFVKAYFSKQGTLIGYSLTED